MPLSTSYKRRRSSLALPFLLASLSVYKIAAQQVPHNNCESVFSYQREQEHWLGRVSPKQDGLKKIEWSLKFAQRGVNTPGTISNLEPYPDKETAYQSMLNDGRPISVVRFHNFIDELPKVTHVELNGKVLCSDQEYGPPSRTSKRQQIISVSTELNSTQIPTPTTRPTPSSTQPPKTSNYMNNFFLKNLKPEKPTSSVEPIYIDTHINLGAPPEECGILGPSGLAVGGTVVARGHFPWMAALYIDDDPDPLRFNLVYKCVATLISSRTLITAWHCIQGATAGDVRIYVGRHDLEKHPEPGAVLLEIEKIETHPQNEGILDPAVDISLLILRTNVQFSNYVRPICMWASNTYLSPDSGENAQICGWGYDQSGKGTRFPTMVNVRTLTQEACVRQLTWAKDFITSRTICATNDLHHGPCLGDSGGSLMVQRNNRTYIRGVISVGQRMGNKCDLKYPVIYCDVAQHREWIERTMVQ